VAGVLLLMVSALTLWFLSANSSTLDFTLRLESAEYEPLDGQTLKMEGHAITFPFQFVYGRVRFTIGEHVLHTEQFNLAGNILNQKNVYSFTLWNPKWRANPDGPVSGGGTLVADLKDGRVEHAGIRLYFPKGDRDIWLRAFPLP